MELKFSKDNLRLIVLTFSIPVSIFLLVPVLWDVVSDTLITLMMSHPVWGVGLIISIMLGLISVFGVLMHFVTKNSKIENSGLKN